MEEGDIINRIREIRISRGMSQTELATKSGISRVALSLIETGRTRYASSKTLLMIASALGTTMDDLFFEEDVKSISHGE